MTTETVGDSVLFICDFHYLPYVTIRVSFRPIWVDMAVMIFMHAHYFSCAPSARYSASFRGKMPADRRVRRVHRDRLRRSAVMRKQLLGDLDIDERCSARGGWSVALACHH